MGLGHGRAHPCLPFPDHLLLPVQPLPCSPPPSEQPVWVPNLLTLRFCSGGLLPVPSPSSLFTLTFWEAFPEALLQPSKKAHCLCMRSPFPSAFAHGPVLLPMGSSSQVEIMAMLCLFLFSELFGSSSSKCINLYMVYLILLYHFLLAKYCDNYPIDFFFN